MESLKLTKEQENKLLEMAEKLFPEYFFDEEGEDYYIDEDGIINFLIPIKENEYKCGEIHWFEFCMTYLAEKIIPAFCDMEKMYSGIMGNDESDCFKKHPIDYLYEEFKKLKL